MHFFICILLLQSLKKRFFEKIGVPVTPSLESQYDTFSEISCPEIATACLFIKEIKIIQNNFFVVVLNTNYPPKK